MKKQHGIIKNLLFVLLIIILTLSLMPSVLKSLKFGLDLQGGFEVLYQVSSLDDKNLTEDMLKNTYKTLSKRIDSLGVSEPVITIEGDNKIRVQLAGVTDQEEARNTLGQVATLTFRDSDNNLLMSSDVLSSGGASIGESSNKLPAVALSISKKDEFYRVTSKISKTEDQLIVIWLDFEEGTDSYETEKGKCGTESSRCLSAASVSEGFSSDVVIQGNFTNDEVKTLVTLINSGSLPTKLDEISSKTVSASFGENSLDKTAKAGLIAVIVIIACLIFIYRFSGIIASIGILIYSLLTFLTFWLIGGVLTLPGIAATVLGIGMAIDSNIINFSRIKDELEAGHNLQTAYKKGNSNSIVTIIDANLTTLIAAIVLFVLGESSIKGFATMLIISIFVTMFVMVFLTRLLLNGFVKSGFFDERKKLFIGITKKELKGKKRFEKLEFVKSSKYFIIVSLICIISGVISLFTTGLNLDVDFKGGSSITIKSNSELKVENIKSDIEEFDYELVSIENIDKNTIDLRIGDNLSNKEVETVNKYFKDKYEASTDIGVISSIVRDELVRNAILSVIIASFGIIIYVSLRFKFSYAVGGVVALFHDAFIIIALFSIFKFQVSSIFIAAILTIIGYSINDTIVIFDRIKENLKILYKNKITDKSQLVDVVNISIRQTLTRSIITTVATLIPVMFLIFMGSHEIFVFNIALLFGLIAGSYSTIFIASQIWINIEAREIGKPEKKKWYEEKTIEEKSIKGINS